MTAEAPVRVDPSILQLSVASATDRGAVRNDRYAAIISAIRSGVRPNDVARQFSIGHERVRQVWTAETGTSLPRETQAERFWARVNKDGPINPRRPELGPCWLWTGAKMGTPDKAGISYGQSSYGGRVMGAHKASFLMHGGTIPAGFDVMHACDTKSCVRPDHLSAGTRSDNLLDGFQAPANQGVCAGENNGRARLTWDDVHAIRVARKAGASQPDLARRYGVSQVQISHIVRGSRWPESKCPLHAREAAAA